MHARMRPLLGAIARRSSFVSLAARPLPRPQLRSLARAASTGHNLIPQIYPDVQLDARPDEGLWEFLQREGRLDEVKDKVAITCLASGGRSLTFGQLQERVSAAAHELVAMGFGQGDVASVHLHNCEQFVVSFLAVASLGGTISPSNPLYTAHELAEQQRDSSATICLSSRAYEAVVDEAATLSGVSTVTYIEDEDCFANTPGTRRPPPPRATPLDIANDVLALPYSSGTTGKPKGVMLSHRNIMYNCVQAVAADIVETDTVLTVLPLYHIYGMTLLMLRTILSRAHMLLMPRFEPQPFLEAVQNYKVSAGFVVPPICVFLAKHPLVKEYDLTSLRYLFTGAAPLDAATQLSITQITKVLCKQGWGMTELSPLGTAARPGPDADPVAGSCGVLVPSTEGLIVDTETDEPLPPHTPGELLIRGPQVMLGYLNRPDATAETIRADGFLRTGDLGYYDEEGNVFLQERLKELIKVKGFQVAPAEIEGLLLEHEQLDDACVIGVADEASGEVPKAFVVRKAEASLSEDGVRDYLALKLAPYKVPRDVEFVDAIPKSPSGKILRRMLR